MDGQLAETLPAPENNLQAENASFLRQPKAVWATALAAVFAFMGITSPEFIVADGIQVGPDHREKALAGALQAATSLRAA